MLEALNPLADPLLDLLQYVIVCLVLGGPTECALDVVSPVLMEGKNHLLQPTDSALADAAQCASGRLHHRGTITAYVQLVPQDLRSFSAELFSIRLMTRLLMHWIIQSLVQDFEFLFAVHDEVSVS